MTVVATDGAALSPVDLMYFAETACPRMVAIVNGVPSVAISATATLYAHGFQDTCDIVVPLDRDLSIELKDAATPAGIDAPSPSVYVELWAGLAETPQDGSTSLDGLSRYFLGVVNDYEGSGVLATVTLHCRGLSANLADIKLTRIALGQTSVSFGAQEAAAAGLKFTSNLTLQPITIQQVLGREFVGGSNLQTSIYRKTAADLLKESATFDDADVWVEDDTLHYERAANVVRGPALGVVHGRDTVAGDDGLRVSHALRFSNNVKVDVQGSLPRTRTSSRATLRFDPATGAVEKSTTTASMTRSIQIFGTNQTISQNLSTGKSTVTTGGSTGGTSSSKVALASETNVERYKFYLRNADAATCSRVATAIARQIASLEYSVSLALPMTRRMLALRIVTPIDLSGVVLSLFNDRYYPRKITHTISLSEGWRVRIDAINHTMLQGELD